MQALNILKIGGSVLDDAAQLDGFLRHLAALPDRSILVHGGGAIATRLGQRLGIAPKYEEGRRITDAATLELVTMVYGGLLNKQLVAGLQSLGCRAVGLTGADGGLLRAAKRPVGTIDYGFVGDLTADGVDATFLASLLGAGLCPVIAPLTYDGAGGLLNTNADTIAQAVAVAMAGSHAVRLVYCFEKAGVLRDRNDETSLLRTIDAASFETLKAAGVIAGGMIPKVQNALAAVAAGVESVTIGRGSLLPGLLSGTEGTRIA